MSASQWEDDVLPTIFIQRGRTSTFTTFDLVFPPRVLVVTCFLRPSLSYDACPALRCAIVSRQHPLLIGLRFYTSWRRHAFETLRPGGYLALLCRADGEGFTGRLWLS